MVNTKMCGILQAISRHVKPVAQLV